jgi:hypothetical protein
MKNYLVKLTPNLVNLASEGSLDTSLLNGCSLQRTLTDIMVVDDAGSRKIVGRLKDCENFDDVVVKSSSTPTVTTDSASGGYTSNFSAQGTVVSDGGSPILERGFVLENDSTLPTILDPTYIDNNSEVGTFSTTNFNCGSCAYETYVRAYAINANGTSYGEAIQIYIGICLAEGTLVSLKDGVKPIEDVDYNDDILVWNFDDGKFDIAKPLYIKKEETAREYNLLEFSDGSYLKTIIQHRIFNKQAGRFTYPMSEETPIGTITFNVKSEEITLTNKSVISESVKSYNVITYYHMNLFGNGILTSIGYNNLYPIHEMKFVKDNREIIPIENYPDVSEKYYLGLRLGHQIGISVADTIQYINIRENIKKL